MPDDLALQESLAALTRFFIGDRSVEQTLDRVAQMSSRAIPAVSFAGITMMERGSARTAVFTDRAAPMIDQVQYDTGDGPCIEAFRTGTTLGIESTREDVRWPAFNRSCLAHGIMSTLSIPLTVDSTTHGALNLYSRSERAFDHEQSQTAALFGAQAAIVLANAVAYWGARARAEQLEQALNTRGPIEQAKGIIMATMRCDPDAAFQILVRQSQHQNRKLNEIAAEVVAAASRRA